jgi:hypothetical protein
MTTTKPPAILHNPFTFPQHEKDTDRRRSDPIVMPFRNADGDTMPPPRKIRRLSGNDVGRYTPAVLKSSAATVQGRGRDNGDNTKQRTPTPMSLKKVADKEKEKEKENLSTDSSGSKSGQRQLQDYSTFKGRGRYAKDLES